MLLVLFACGSGKDLKDVAAGQGVSQSTVLSDQITLDEILQIENWRFENTSLKLAPEKISQKCVTWEFINREPNRVKLNGVLLVKVDSTAVKYFSKIDSLEYCAIKDGTTALYYQDYDSLTEHFIWSYLKIPDENEIPIFPNWSVKSLDWPAQGTDFLHASNKESIDLEFDGINPKFVSKVLLGWSKYSEKEGRYVHCTEGCASEHPFSTRMTAKLPLLNDRYLLLVSLLLIDGRESYGDGSNFDINQNSLKPTNVGIVINNGSETTNNSNVYLSLTAKDNSNSPIPSLGIKMYVTNEAQCQSGGMWKGFENNISWTLKQSNSIATVYVKFKDEYGNESECMSDSILHDDIPPIGSIVINFGASSTYNQNATLSFNTDNAEKMYITSSSYDCSRSSGQNWEAFSFSKSWTLVPIAEVAKVLVKFMDKAGNKSSCYSATISTPKIYLTHKWLEGLNHHTIISSCSINQIQDFRTTNSLVVAYAPFTNMTLLSFTGCIVVKNDAGSYSCDHTLLNSNCSEISPCFEYVGFKTKQRCLKPSSVP